jgi:8-oxo-dGTP pyrophosphatase MutT (NUDIX family)
VTEATRGQWRTYGERVIYDSPWVRLGQIDVEQPEGKRYWHHVARFLPAALLALVDDEDRVLLAWRHRFVADTWGWEIPGGLLDEGEEPIDAARRELEEETGYRAGHVEHLVSFEPMPGAVDSPHAVFLGRDPQRVRDTLDVSEAVRLEWCPLTEVRGRIAAGEITNASTIIALLALSRP